MSGSVLDTMSAHGILGLTRKITKMMLEQHGIIMTVGIQAVATGEIQALAPEYQVSIVVDNNYSV